MENNKTLTNIEQKVKEHSEILARHEKQLSELIKTDEALAEDIKVLHKKLDDGFYSIKNDLAFIRDKAFDSIPDSVANNMKLNSLIWQVVGVCVAVASFIIAAIKIHGQ